MGTGGGGKTYFSCSSKVDAKDVPGTATLHVEMIHPVGTRGKIEGYMTGTGRVVVVKDLFFLQQQRSRCQDVEMIQLVGVMERRVWDGDGKK